MAGKKISQLSSSLAPSLSGVTVVEQNGTTYKSTLQTLRTILVDSGSHSITGSITASYFVGDGSKLTNLPLSGHVTTSSFNSYTSSVNNFSSSFDQRIKNATNEQVLDGFAITGSNIFKGGQTILGSLIVGTGSLHNDNPEILHVENSGSYNIAHFQGNDQYYTQINLKNLSSGNNASADIVATADNGTENVHYVDMGINSSTYTGGFVGYANDAYLINAGKDLYVGTIGGVNHPSDLKLFALNYWENPQIIISGSKQISFNTGSVSNGYQYEFSGSVKLKNQLKVDGSVTASYFVGDGSQLTNLPTQYTDRLVNGDLEVVLDNKGSINTPLLLPTNFTVYLSEDKYTGPNSGFTLNGEPWSFDVHFEVNPNGVVETQIDNNLVFFDNPGYNNDDSFDFNYDVHGISGYTFQISLYDVTQNQAGWTRNIAVSQPPSYPSTIKSSGAIVLESDSKTLTLGTDGIVTLTNGGTIIDGTHPAQFGGTVPSIELKPFATFDDNQKLVVYSTVAEGNHVHLTSGDVSITDIVLGDDTQHIRTNTDGGMTIGTAGGLLSGTGYAWSFNSNGTLTTPGTILGNNDGLTLSTGISAPGSALNLGGSSITFNYAMGPQWSFDGDATTTLPGDLDVTSGVLNLSSTSEKITPIDDFTSEILHDLSESSILYITGATSNITPNITMNEVSNRGVGITVIVEQGSTAYTIDGLKINDNVVSINWYGGAVPDGVINGIDAFSFSLLNINGTWKVFGQITTF